jgi:5'-nucleotidase
MRILITNDDGYQAKGLKVLVEIMKQFGEVTVIAPKKHQSGMSMAVSIGFKQIAHKDLGEGWHYVDATPASCVKYGLNTIFLNEFPDVVVSGINHGSNASTASCYSGTLGAAAEAALNGSVIYKRLLNSCQLGILLNAFHSHDLTSIRLNGRINTGIDALSVH